MAGRIIDTGLVLVAFSVKAIHTCFGTKACHIPISCTGPRGLRTRGSGDEHHLGVVKLVLQLAGVYILFGEHTLFLSVAHQRIK